MSDMTGLADLVAQVKEASRSIERGDSAFSQRLDGIEASVNDLYKKRSAPVASAAPAMTRFQSARTRSDCASSNTI